MLRRKITPNFFVKLNSLQRALHGVVLSEGWDLMEANLIAFKDTADDPGATNLQSLVQSCTTLQETRLNLSALPDM